MINEILSTCYIEGNLRTIANFSHLIPVILSVFLAIFVFIKARYNFFSKVFFIFVAIFSLWLIGDFIAWSSLNYNLIYSIWSFLDYFEIVFYVLGLYFVMVFVKKSDISKLFKIGLFTLTIPALYLTLTKQSVTGFNSYWCEASNNEFLGNYKLIIEGIILLVILFYTIIPFIKKYSRQEKKARLIMLGSMFLFLSVFGVTEYIASMTGNYELNLYSLFLLPVFVLAIIYAVFELDIFNFKLLGTHYLVVGLMVLMAGQLFFINGTADILLTILSIIITAGLSFILFKNLKRESDQRVRIEKLSVELENANEKLKSLDKLKTEFLSLASHQLRSPLTAIQGYTSMLLEGDYGKVGDKQKEAIDRVLQSSKHLTKVVEDLLNVSKIEMGGMQYVKAPFDFEKTVRDIENDLSITAEKKGLKFSFETDNPPKGEAGKAPYIVNGDMEKLRQVILNLTDNAIKYTREGNIKVKLIKDPARNADSIATAGGEKRKKIRLSIADTGIGITPEIKATLFQKFARGDGGKVDSMGTGLGLYLAKEIIEAHKGKIWAESGGEGKGSTFFIELNAE